MVLVQTPQALLVQPAGRSGVWVEGGERVRKEEDFAEHNVQARDSTVHASLVVMANTMRSRPLFRMGLLPQSVELVDVCGGDSNLP